MSVAEQNLTSRITYTDLYRRWEKSNWSAMDLDFTQDKQGWDDLSEIQRKSALWIYSMFFFGEDRVAEDLSPYIEAAPITSLKNRWKKMAWRASSTCCVVRKYFCSSVGAASM